MRRFFTHFAIVAALAIAPSGAGCAAFTRAEMDLVTQAQRGIDLVAQHAEQRDRAVAELTRMRREKLDHAFDEDVRLRAMQETLDPDWVIEARTAYAVALDAYAKAQAASERAADVRRQNLAAVTAALDRLRWLQSVRLRLDPFRLDGEQFANGEDQP